MAHFNKGVWTGLIAVYLVALGGTLFCGYLLEGIFSQT